MMIIGLEEHDGLPVIYEAAHKAKDRLALTYDVLKKTGEFIESKAGFPEGIYDLGEGRINAMDDAGIDVSILSYPTPNAEGLEPSRAKGLTRRADVRTPKGEPAPLSEAPMSAAPFSVWRAIGVVFTTLLGFGFFNALIGVFGLSVAITALLVFISSAVLIFLRPQPKRTPS